MPEVNKLWKDDENFIVELSIAGSSVIYAFPIEELYAGASLAKMMTLKVRATLASGGWNSDPAMLKSAASASVTALRPLVELHFVKNGPPASD